MGNDKEEENTWFEIGFEDESWKQEKTSPTLQAMHTQMREDKQEKSAIERAEREAALGRGYCSLVMASNIVAGLPESTTLRTSLPSYLTWARAISARKQEWLVSGGLTRPKDDLSILVRQVQREEESLVYLSDFIEWAIEVGCTVAPSAVEEARRECAVSDSFDRRVRLWEIERSRAELAGAKTEKPEVILAREARLAALERERGEIIASLQGRDHAPGHTDNTTNLCAATIPAKTPAAAIARADYLRELILDAVAQHGFDDSAISRHITAAAQGPECDPPCIVTVTAHRITWKNHQGGWSETTRKDLRARIKRLKEAQEAQ